MASRERKKTSIVELQDIDLCSLRDFIFNKQRTTVVAMQQILEPCDVLIMGRGQTGTTQDRFHRNGRTARLGPEILDDSPRVISQHQRNTTVLK